MEPRCWDLAISDRLLVCRLWKESAHSLKHLQMWTRSRCVWILKDVDTIVNTIALISKSFGGINLEDIAAPRCFEIEKKLKSAVTFRSSTMTSTVLLS